MMQMSALIAATIGIALSIAAHLGSLRIGAMLLTAYAASFAVGTAATIVASVMLRRIDGEPLWSAITALVLYGAWWFIFLNLVQGLEFLSASTFCGRSRQQAAVFRGKYCSPDITTSI